MMSEQQFDELIRTVTRNQEDHDLIVEISTNMKWMKEQYLGHIKEDSEHHAIANGKITSAHKRVDWLMISGVLAIIILAVTLFIKK